MLRVNPLGRTPRTRTRPQTVRIGRGQSIHILNPDSGLPLCMPAEGSGKGRAQHERVRPVDAEHVTCMRCEKLMIFNSALRGDDLKVGGAEALLSRQGGRKGNR